MWIGGSAVTVVRRLGVSVFVVVIAGCSVSGEGGPVQSSSAGPDLGVVDGTATVPEAQNRLSKDQLWDPVSTIDPSVLNEFIQTPSAVECTTLESVSWRVCDWRAENGQRAGSYAATVYTSPVPFSEVRGQSFVEDPRDVTVGGFPAIMYAASGKPPTASCDVVWGNPTGTTIAVISARGPDLVDGCAMAHQFAEAVYPATRSVESQLGPSVIDSLWNPKSLEQTPVLKQHSLDQGNCDDTAPTLRDCRFARLLPGQDVFSTYHVTVYSSAMSFDSFAQSRRAFADVSDVSVAGQPAIRYNTVPHTCSVAFAGKTGTVWVRVVLGRDGVYQEGDPVPPELSDEAFCATATSFATDMHQYAQ